MEEQKKDQVVLKCIPKEPIPNTSEVYLTLKMGKRVLVEASRIRDGFGGENEILFSNIQVNQGVTKGNFDFKVPKGIPVVSLKMSDLKF